MKPTPDEIDAAVSEWHKSNSEDDLFVYLGWTWPEYQAWLRDYQAIPHRPLACWKEQDDGDEQGTADAGTE